MNAASSVCLLEAARSKFIEIAGGKGLLDTELEARPPIPPQLLGTTIWGVGRFCTRRFATRGSQRRIDHIMQWDK